MKILQVAFLLLFNYLDSLPKLYIMAHTDATLFYKADDHIYMYLR